MSEVSVVVNNYCTWDPCSVRLGGGGSRSAFSLLHALHLPLTERSAARKEGGLGRGVWQGKNKRNRILQYCSNCTVLRTTYRIVCSDGASFTPDFAPPFPFSSFCRQIATYLAPTHRYGSLIDNPPMLCANRSNNTRHYCISRS